MPVTFEEVWEREFAPALAARRRKEAERQTESFLDTTLTLCGEEVRQMTPHDMLTLDALGNAFISGAPDGQVYDLDAAGLIWELSPSNNHTSSLPNLWRRAHLLRRIQERINRVGLKSIVTEISAYVDRMLMTEPSKKTAEQLEEEKRQSAFDKPPRTHFLSSLIVNLAGDIGHIDPMSGELLAHTPLPRLMQYAASIDAKKGGPRTYDEHDTLRNRCVDRMNQINAAARQSSTHEIPSSPAAQPL